ncbi:MAG: OmpA family protein [Cyclobacteriaceae bacterium]|nr:OmpA family protein [Cyclobacteriaceae bacterium]
MRKKISAILFLLFFVLTCYGQSLKEFTTKGDGQYAAKEYTNALKTYMDGLRLYPKDAWLNFRAGLTYLFLPNKTESLRYLQTAFTLNPSIDPYLYYYLGLSYQSNRQFEKAKEFFEEFKRRNPNLAGDIDKRIRQIQFADSLSRIPSNVVVENVGKVINSSFHEYSPLVSLDGNTMVFTSNRPDPDASDKSLPNFEDIYITKKVNGEWTMPKKISPKINIRFNDAAASLSPDGNTLLLYYEYGGGDIYVSKRDGEDWTKPIPLNENINTPFFWETSAFLTSDGKKLFFSSNRPGGMGNLDIYVSEMEETGDWGKAENLGPTINTPGREDSPSLDPDGSVLYFSSDGHPSMGGTDIFKSELKDGKWQKPVNMGYPINSIEDDSFFSISEDRKRAYFSTLREEGNAEIYTLTFIEPGLDIASVIIPAAANPPNTTRGSAAAEHQSTTPPPPVPTNPRPGEAPKVPAAPKTTAPITATPKTTAPITAAPKTTAPKTTAPKTAAPKTTTPITAARVNDFSIIYIFFAIGEDNLNEEAVTKLDRLNVALTENQQLNILIEGHTDNTGSQLLNKALSIKRANMVAKYLTLKGVTPSRISLEAYGATRPIVSNDDEREGREINRRVAVSIR